MFEIMRCQLPQFYAVTDTDAADFMFVPSCQLPQFYAVTDTVSETHQKECKCQLPQFYAVTDTDTVQIYVIYRFYRISTLQK